MGSEPPCPALLPREMPRILKHAAFPAAYGLGGSMSSFSTAGNASSIGRRCFSCGPKPCVNPKPFPNLQKHHNHIGCLHCGDRHSKRPSAAFTRVQTQQNHICYFHIGSRLNKTTSAAFTSGPATAKPRQLLSLCQPPEALKGFLLSS